MTILGESVSDLQENVVFANGGITGNLKYVEGFTQFSDDPELQEGNYLAVKFESETGAVITAELIGAEESQEPVTIDSDMNLVVRVSNVGQALKVVSTTSDGSSTMTYYFNGLVLEPKEE